MVETSQPISKVLVFLSYLFTAVIFAGLGGLGLWFYQQKNIPPAADVSSPTPIPTEAPVSLPPATLTPGVSDLELIRQALAARHSKPAADTQVEINHNTGTHAQGVVRFSGEISGGWWLAYNDVSGWIIVDDGNGTISCAAIEPYNFPTSIVPECYDETSASLIVR